jgi:hypothetical protein
MSVRPILFHNYADPRGECEELLFPAEKGAKFSLGDRIRLRNGMKGREML